nr:hypothetical protein [Mycoplasmopsis bovis]
MSELFKRLVYLIIFRFFKNWWAYSNIITSVDRINEFKGRVNFDGTLKSYNSDEVTFSQWSRKGKVKGSKDFTFFTLVLIYQRANLSRPYQGNMLDSTIFEDFLENVPALGNISCW